MNKNFYVTSQIRGWVWWLGVATILLFWIYSLVDEYFISMSHGLVHAPLSIDFAVYLKAARFIKNGMDPYLATGGTYLYHPFLAYFLSLLPLQNQTLAWLWFFVNLIGTTGLTIGVAYLFRLERTWAGLAIVAMVMSPSALFCIRLGNISTIVGGILMLGILLWTRKKSVPYAGVVVGIAAVLKVTPTFIGIYVAVQWLRSKIVCRRNRDEKNYCLGNNKTNNLPYAGLFLIGFSALIGVSLFVPYLGSYLKTLHVPLSKLIIGSNFGWLPWMYSVFGIVLPPKWFVFIAAFISGLLAMRRYTKCHWLILFALLVYGSPIAWAHLYMLLLPILGAYLSVERAVISRPLYRISYYAGAVGLIMLIGWTDFYFSRDFGSFLPVITLLPLIGPLAGIYVTCILLSRQHTPNKFWRIP